MEIIKKQLGQQKVSDAMPAILIACNMYGLNPSRLKQFNIAKKIVINSIQKN